MSLLPVPLEDIHTVFPRVHPELFQPLLQLQQTLRYLRTFSPRRDFGSLALVGPGTSSFALRLVSYPSETICLGVQNISKPFLWVLT